jgi:hypothetical protein
MGERSSTALLIDTLSRAKRPQTNTNLSLATSRVGQKLASSPVAVNLSSGRLVCVLESRDRVLLAAVCVEWPCEEVSPTIGYDDALEVEELVKQHKQDWKSKQNSYYMNLFSLTGKIADITLEIITSLK